MIEVLPFIVTGLTTGAVYGLAGIGLVLTYKTSGVFNFAHGAIAAVAAYVFYSTHVSLGWSWPLAAAAAVLVLGPLMGLGLELLARSIQGSSLALQVASTVGLLLVIEAIVVLIYGTLELRTVPQFLPQGDVRVFSTNVQWSDIITFGFALAVTAGLSIMFRTTRLGLAMRAVVDNPSLLDLSGTSPARTRRFAWTIGTTLAAASGVLFAPLLPLDPIQLTLLVVAAFGAAAVGAFTSLPLTFGGGLLIGVLAALSTKYFSTGVLAGLPPALPFVVLFTVLLVFPRRYLVAGAGAIARPRTAWSAPPSFQLGSGAALLVVLALVPSFAGIHLGDWTIAVGTAIVFLSLGLLARTSGQVSLAHVSFMAIGAAAFSHLAVGQSFPWLLALVAAGLIAVPIGALLAIPAIRLTGLYLALATFGFGVLLQFMFYTQGFMFGDNGATLDMPRPAGFDGDSAYYYLVLGLATLVTLTLVVLDRSRLGRLLRGLADSPTALETNGAAVNVTRVLVFCLSAFMAAVGGALIGVAQTTVSADAFPPLLSLTYFVLIVIVVGGNPWYAIMAAASLVLIPSYVTGEQVGTYLQLLFGLAAILVAALPGRATQVPAAVRRAIDSAFGRRRTARAPVRAAAGASRVEPGALEIHGLQVRSAAWSPSRTSRCSHRRVASPGSSAPTAPARPPPSTPARASTGPAAAGRCWTAMTSLGTRRLRERAEGSAARSRRWSCSSRSRCATTSLSGPRGRSRAATRCGTSPAGGRTRRGCASGRSTRSSCATSPIWPTCRSAPCPPASGGSSSWPGASRVPTRSCCSTSLRPVSTAWRRSASAAS
jgi:branched-subunit amino acid ABC-type transport system permease component